MPRDDQNPEAILADDVFLRRLASRLVRGRDAEDAAQDAWLAALQKKDGDEDPEGRGTRRPWLVGTLRRIAARDRRLSATRRARERAAAREDRETSVEDLLEQHALRQRVVDAVVALPEHYRRPILLRYFEGLSPREVARRMDLPTESTRTRIKRGLALLRETLDSRDGGSTMRGLALLAGGAAMPASLTSTLTGVLFVTIKTKIALLSILLLVVLGMAAWLGGGFSDDDGIQDPGQAGGAELASQDSQTEARRHAEVQDAGEEDAAIGTPGPSEESEGAAGTVTPSKFGRLEIQVLWESDKSAAKDVPIRLLPFHAPDPFLNASHFRSDDKGMVIIDRCHAGTVLVSSSLGGMQRLKVEAGETNREPFIIPTGSRVKGRVLNPDGQAVAGAAIFVGDMGHPFIGGPVTFSKADGTFDLASVGSDGMCLLGARAEGFVASPCVMLFTSQKTDIETTLHLGPPTATLDVRVLDPNRKPVSDARVVVGKARFDQKMREDGDREMPASGLQLRTDGLGRCVVDGAGPGTTEIAVRSPLWAPYKGSVEVQVSGRQIVEIILQDTGRVEGRITAGGVPAERVTVRIGSYAAIDGHFARTDSDGRFIIEGVAAGRRKIVCESDKLGKQSGEVDVVVGETARWDAALQVGGRISGIVVDEGSRPLPGITISATGTGKNAAGKMTMINRSAKTDGQGRFAIENLQAAAYRVAARGPGFAEIAWLPEAVKPGEENLRIVVDSTLLSEGSMTGIVLDHEGEPLGGVRITAANLDITTSSQPLHLSKKETGRFDIPKLVPGRYRLSLRSGAHGHIRSRPFVVKKDQTTDVGTLRFEPAGRFEIVLNRSGGIAGDARIYAFHLEHENNNGISLDGDQGQSSPMAPGEYRVSVEAEGAATRSVIATIKSGEITPIAFDIEPGFERIFIFTSAAEPQPKKVEIEVRDAENRILHRTSRRSYRNRSPDCRIRFSAAARTLVVTDDQGRRSQVTLEEALPETTTLRLE